GGLCFSDLLYNGVKKVSADTGIITRVAGLPNGQIGFGSDGMPAVNFGMREPAGIALDRAGNLFIAEQVIGRIIRVDKNTGIATIVAGGAFDESRPGAPPKFVRLIGTYTVAFDNRDNLLFVDQSKVWKVLPFPFSDGFPLSIRIATPISSGSYTTDRSFLEISGDVSLKSTVTHLTLSNDRGYSITYSRAFFRDGRWSAFNTPLAVGVNRFTATVYDLNGQSASASITVNYDAPGIAHTVAGNRIAGSDGDGGPGYPARLFSPESVALDSSGALYIADTGNHRIRKVTPQGLITTFAGDGLISGDANLGDGRAAIEASLNAPRGVTVDSSGNVYIAD